MSEERADTPSSAEDKSSPAPDSSVPLDESTEPSLLLFF